MARKKKAADEGDSGGSWLATYADMVTLLLAFFALLLSMAVMDAEKFNAFVESIRHTPIEVLEMFIHDEREQESPEGHVDLEITAMDTLYDLLSEYISEQGLDEEISISKIDDVIHVRFSNAIFFHPDSYALLSTSIPILSYLGQALKTFENEIGMINIMGFTATVDVGTYWMLSGQRAAVVANYINYEAELDTDKITTLGYGRRFPVAPNDTSENMEKNRRVELIIVGIDREGGIDLNEMLDEFYAMEEEHGMVNMDRVEVDEGESEQLTDMTTGVELPLSGAGSADEVPPGSVDTEGERPDTPEETDPQTNDDDTIVREDVSPYDE